MMRFCRRFVSLALLVGCLVHLCLSISGGGTAQAQDTDLDAFRELRGELRERMDDDLEAAVAFLDSLISKNPDSEDHHVLRHSLASRFVADHDYQQASIQFRKLLDYYLERPEQSKHVYGAWMTIQSIQQVAEQSGSDDELKSALDATMQVLDATMQVPDESQVVSNLDLLMPWSQLKILRAQLMVRHGNPRSAQDSIGTLLRDLQNVNESDFATESSMATYIRALRTLAGEDRGNDPWREDCIATLDEVVKVAIEEYPHSNTLQSEFAEVQLMMITNWKQDDPEATNERIEKVSPILATFAFDNRSVQTTLRRIDLHRKRMAAAKPVDSLVGQPAPAWDIDAWVNVIDMDREMLEGKVVLLDFWAMWCGPCIATFPHLQEWRAEFADRGFEIVGVTQYYNFQWDEQAKRAIRADKDLTPQQEHQTMVSFLEHYGLEHPVLVTPEGSNMQSNFGVRGIPHAVLIDRQGIVQLVETGAGQETAREIHAKIKQLVADGSPREDDS